MKKIQITVCEHEARILFDALDLYMRLGMRQYSVLMEHWRNDAIRAGLPMDIFEQRAADGEHAVRLLKTALDPEHHPNASVGIRESPEQYRRAYDMLQTIRHTMAWDRTPEGGNTVDFNKPWFCAEVNRHAKEEPNPRVQGRRRMTLTKNHVNEVFLHCLYSQDELPADGSPPSGAVLVEGIVRKFGLHPERLDEKRCEIREMLLELPTEFSEGGGWSFLKMCVDKNGHQWGEHPDMEELLVLGIATKQAAYCMPRDMWSLLPGGVPYVAVRTTVLSP